MRDADRFKLLYGPYHPPRCRPGGRLECARYGDVKVLRWSDGPIPWPKGRPPRGKVGVGFVLCGDLVKALRRESALAVAHWWGVDVNTVSRWRRILGVPPYNEGSRRLFRDWLPSKFTPEIRARAVAAANDPVLRAKLERRRRRKGLPPRHGRVWTDADDALLGTAPDAVLAGRFGCSTAAVRRRRRMLARRPHEFKSWVLAAARFVPLSAKRLLDRRLELRLHQPEVARRARIGPLYYGEIERGAVRTVSIRTARALARALRLPIKRLTALRPPARTAPVALERRPVRRREKGNWSPERAALLGTMPDAEVARRVGVAASGVTIRRQRLGIPPYSGQNRAGHRMPRRRRPSLVAVCPEKLTVRRLRLGLSQSALAARARTLGSEISLLETGGRLGVRLDTARRLAAALNCRVADLRPVRR